MAAQVEEKVSESHQDDLDAAPPGVFLSELENQFLDAVRKGNKTSVKKFIKEGKVDLNCMDAKGETALQLAVANNSPAILTLLLKSGADIGNALLQAVSKESIECVIVLLEFDTKEPGTTSKAESGRFFNYLTPLMLAAQNNSYEIVSLLISKGFTIEEPHYHSKSCNCDECKSFGGRLGKSLWKLNTYKALASPAYLSHVFDNINQNKDVDKSKDPIIQAFVLNRKLEELAEIEYEFRNEYLELSNQCEEFAVALLNECRDMEEIESVMTIPDLKDLEYVEVKADSKDAKKLSMLNFAIKNKNEKFVAHAYSQLMLNTFLYKGLSNWEERGVIAKGLFTLFYMALFPFWALGFLVAPTSRFADYLSTPLIKFVSHTGSFLVFLGLLSLNAFQDKFGWFLSITIIDVLIGLWTVGLLVQETKEIIRKGRERYFSQYWNIVTLVMIMLLVLAGIFWLAGYIILRDERGDAVIPVNFFVKAKQKTGHQLVLLSSSFFAVAYLFCCFNIAKAFQVNSTIGPMHLSLTHMINDIMKFLLLFLMIYLAFALALRKVYSTYVFAQISLAKNGTHISEHPFTKVEGTMGKLFWALFGLTELSSFETSSGFKMTQNTGKVLFAVYNISMIVVTMNMLIAMMANTFQKIEDDADIKWKFSRTQMWMQYVDKGSALPPPFNLIPAWPDVLHCFRFICGCCRRRQTSCCDEQVQIRELEEPRETKRESVDSKQRHKIMRYLIQRYIFRLEYMQEPRKQTKDS